MKQATSITCFLLLFVTLSLCEYPRLKYRPPPPYPKTSPSHQIQKKWQQHPLPPQRFPIRSHPQHSHPQHPHPQLSHPQHSHPQLSHPQHSHPHSPRSPIPVRMPPHHKIQMGAASVNRPVAVPVRNFWKNTQTTFRTPLAGDLNMNLNLNKQINLNAKKVYHNHVTSAPVLPKKAFQSSPAILAQEYDFQIQSNNIPTPIKTIKQIGEKGPIHTIPAPNLSLADKPKVIEEVMVKQKVAAEELVRHQMHHQPPEVTFVQIQKSHQYQVTESPETKSSPFYDVTATPLAPAELYQLINAYQQQPATLTVPIIADPLQHYPPVLAHAPQNYVDQGQGQGQGQGQEQFAMDKSGQSLVTAAYNLEPEGAESIAHAHFVQAYFDTSAKNNREEEEAKGGNDTLDGFYVSLPNKEAAEKLASLQAAGKLNSNLNEKAKSGDLFKGEESRDGVDQSDDESYEDYAQDDLVGEDEKQDGGGGEFGSRLQPKN